MDKETTACNKILEALSEKFVDMSLKLVEERTKVKHLEEKVKKLTYELSTHCDCPCDKH